MNMPLHDDDFRDADLRDRFGALRMEEEARAPKFAALSAPQPRHRSQRSTFVGRLIATAACLAMVAAAVFWLPLIHKNYHHSSGQPVASLTQWKAPTDFLLETPGRELLRTVPAIGTSQDYDNTSRSKREHAQNRKPVLP